jgi:glycosyltransferase involved in cell wall biosynthesis
MSKNISIGCVIPFYNEGERILSVLNQITRIKKLSQIICVNDGSSDSAPMLIKEKYPHVNVIDLQNNLGKAGAIRKAMEYLKEDYVFLLDADMEDIKLNVIDEAISKIENNPSIDMIIFDHNIRPRVFEIFARLLRTTIIFSGLRILKTKDLRKTYKAFNPKRFQLELSIDRYMQKGNKKVYWFRPFGTNPIKFSKGNLFHGLMNQIKMDNEVLFQDISFLKVLKLSFTFCMHKCP